MKEHVHISMKIQIPTELEEKKFSTSVLRILGARNSKRTFSINDRQELLISIQLPSRRTRKIARIKNRVRKLIKLHGGKLFYDLNTLNRTMNGSATQEKWNVNIPRLIDKSGQQTSQPNYLWNHDCVRFPQAIQNVSEGKNEYGSLDLSLGAFATNIKVFQFDSGHSTHPVVFDYPRYNSIEKEQTPSAPFNDQLKRIAGKDDLESYYLLMGGFQKPGHSTSTAATMIGITGLEKRDWPNTLETIFSELDAIFKTKISQGLFPYVDFTCLKASKTVILGGKLGTKFFNNVSDAANIIAGLDHAIERQADIITISLGGGFRGKKDKVIRNKIRQAYNQGIIVVCAAGNSRFYSTLFGIVKPAKYFETIAVAALEPIMLAEELQLIPWSKSCGGTNVDISAPGKYIYTPFEISLDKIQDGKLKEQLENGHLYKFGGATSQATVHVSSAAALWKHVYSESLRQDEFYTQHNSHHPNALNNRVVEAFRYGLFHSKNELLNQKIKWTKRWYRDFRGLLDVEKLLNPSFAPTTDECKRSIREFESSGSSSFNQFLVGKQGVKRNSSFRRRMTK